jgi:hypothetical protein
MTEINTPANSPQRKLSIVSISVNLSFGKGLIWRYTPLWTSRGEIKLFGINHDQLDLDQLSLPGNDWFCHLIIEQSVVGLKRLLNSLIHVRKS